LQLLRFACAVETGEWTLAQSLGCTLLGRVSSHNPQRRRVLDDVNRALRRGSSTVTTLPLRSLYAHMLAVWHERVLVASAAQALAKAQQHKEQGNVLFAQAGADGARSASVAQAATTDASPAADAATTSSSTSSLFAAAATQYAAGIAACRAFEELILGDEAIETTCPSRLWFELAAAQLLPSSVTFFSSLSAMTSNTTSAVSSPLLPAAPFSLLQLQFLRASLHSNFAMAALKCASDSELCAQRLLPASASPSAPSTASVTTESSEPQYLLLAQRACEDGLAVMEALSKALGPIRAAVEAAKRAPYAGGRRYKQETASTEQHDDDDDGDARNVFVENLALGSSLPSLSSCSALSSKLYFRHGCAALDRAVASGNASMDSVAGLSFALAVQLQPDGKVRREIEARKQTKARAKAQSLQAHALSAGAV
jgi:hypothetical protein